MTDLLLAYAQRCQEMGLPVLESDCPDRVTETEPASGITVGLEGVRCQEWTDVVRSVGRVWRVDGYWVTE